jgi:signal transduction histidine kinase
VGSVKTSAAGLDERRFGRVIAILVALGFLALLAAGIGAAWITALGEDRTQWVAHTYEVERRVNDVRALVEREESARRGFLLNADPDFMVTFDEASGALPRLIGEIRALTADNPRERANVARLEETTRALTARIETSLADRRSGRKGDALADFEADGGVTLIRQARQTTDAMLAEENRLLARRTDAQSGYDRDFFAVLAAAGAILLLVAVGTVSVIVRYTRELARSRDALQNLNDNLEQAVAERTVDLQRANDEIQRFAYIVSHDLRSPLVNVLGFTTELEASTKPLASLIERVEAAAPQIVTDEARRAVREDVPEAIGFIRTSTQKMDRLINAILKLSREGRRAITPERLDMDGLVQGVADGLRHRVAALGAEIVIEKPLPAVIGDRLAIDQILSNLIENAVKYLKPGRPGLIRVRGRHAGGRVIIEVEDNGRGIDPKDHGRVFDLFRRSGLQDQPGEGIGLAHVRALAYRLGGTVSCESALDQGAIFRLSLPLVYSGDETK